MGRLWRLPGYVLTDFSTAHPKRCDPGHRFPGSVDERRWPASTAPPTAMEAARRDASSAWQYRQQRPHDFLQQFQHMGRTWWHKRPGRPRGSRLLRDLSKDERGRQKCIAGRMPEEGTALGALLLCSIHRWRRQRAHLSVSFPSSGAVGMTA